MNNQNILIIGGGIIGFSIAFELAKKGTLSTIIDKGSSLSEASTAAAGMLGAHVELHQPGAFYELCKKSHALYKDWTDTLYEVSQISAQYINRGIVRVAFTDEDERELKSRLSWIGEDVRWLSSTEIRQIEPTISEEIRGGLWFQDDHQVHVHHLAQSLRSSVLKLGCTIMESTPALSLIQEKGRIVGAKTSNGSIFADQTIITAGAWSTELLSSIDLHLPVHPIKGQCYSIRPEFPIIQNTVFTKGCYIVPKQDGSLLIGATQETVGFDKKVTISAIASIHEIAERLLPSIHSAELLSTWAGLRPATPDELPYMGTITGFEGLVIATGHFRNGILLAPITGEIVSDLVLNGNSKTNIEAFSPERAIM